MSNKATYTGILGDEIELAPEDTETAHQRRRRLKRKKKEQTLAKIRERQAKGIPNEWYYIIRYIAIITMFIDHLGKVLYSAGSIGEDTALTMNMIGRFAFPLFAFSLVECFHFTKNRNKHLLQIGILFLMSELPFDMAMVLDKPLAFSTAAFQVQNTCSTLFLGFLALKITNVDWNNKLKKVYKPEALQRITASCIKVILGGAFILLADLLHTDYAWRGILLIMLFEFSRNRKHQKVWQVLSISLYILTMGESIPMYLVTYLVLLPIWFGACNQKCFIFGESFKKFLAGRFTKTLCRFFYPAHLVLLVLLKIVLMYM